MANLASAGFSAVEELEPLSPRLSDTSSETDDFDSARGVIAGVFVGALIWLTVLVVFVWP